MVLVPLSHSTPADVDAYERFVEISGSFEHFASRIADLENVVARKDEDLAQLNEALVQKDQELAQKVEENDKLRVELTARREVDLQRWRENQCEICREPL